MLPRDLVYVGHMLDMARKAVSKTQGISRETYDADENLRLALIHLVQTIGEAARQVSVHDYVGVDDDIVWQVVTEDLPQLVAALESIASQAPPPPRATG
jgi:uncharacterized protein with HEPN domain